MKTSIFSIFLAATAIWLSSCTSGRITSATEYDSVYFGKSDNIVYNEQQPQDGEDNQRQYAQDTDESRDDDFYYSRRMRRFGNNNNNDWRYYDPYYSNDLYYSMGTPSWNTWNNYGWYNYTSPYVGSPWGYYNGMSGFGYGYGNGYYGYNNPYMWGSYNPWVNTYYGYSPWTYGYCGYNYGMYNPYYYSMYSPWNNPYSYYPYTYVNQSHASVGTQMPNRGVTAGLAPSSSLVNNGGVRPSLGGRSNTGTVINPSDVGVSTGGALTPARTNPTRYTTPRSDVEFGNKPPRTYTSGELNPSRPTTTPTRTWTPSDTKTNTSPAVQPSHTTRPPVYTAPSDTRTNTEPTRSNTNRPPVNTTPKETTPKSSWTPPKHQESAKPSQSEPVRHESRPAPSFSAPSHSAPSQSSGGGRKPR